VQGSAATLLTTVQQIDPIYVDLHQSSAEGLQLRRDVASGQLKLNGPNQAKVVLTLEDGSQYPLAGTLQFSGTTVDPATGSVTVRALFPNPRHVLLPGMFVRAGVEQGVNENALQVPVPAVTRNPQGQATVFVVGSDNKLATRPVQAKSIVGDSWVVDAGLNDGEQVVVSGAQKVAPGTLVKVVQAQRANLSTAQSQVGTAPSAPRAEPVPKTVVASEAK
jgi:membrane fusion protein (multidrug efflux system)